MTIYTKFNFEWHTQCVYAYTLQLFNINLIDINVYILYIYIF